MFFLQASLPIKILIIIGSLLIIAFLSVVISRSLMNAKTNSLIKTITEDVTYDDVINESDLDDVPDIVANWLREVNVVDSPRIKTLSFKQTGDMRLEPTQDWMTPSAYQRVNVVNPGYVWQVDLPMAFTKGRDTFYQGDASMLIKVGGLVPMVNEKDNDKLNESSLHRFLLELPWYPSAALEPYITWEQINTTQAVATINIYNLEADATFTFEDNDLIKVEAMRYKDTDASAERLLCFGEFLDYDFVDSIKIPSKVNVSWVIDDDIFTWYKIRISDIQINKPN